MPYNEKLSEKKFQEWKKRNWFKWLGENLSFPFTAKRVEDEAAYFADVAGKQPFSLGHTMEVPGLETEEDPYGVLVKVKESRKTGSVPLADMEVVSRGDKNFWPVREYVV